jgi:hypothetical protein
MNPDIEKYVTLLERRLFLLRALAQQFITCRKEFIGMDLDGMYRRIAEQEELCRQLRSQCPSIRSLQRTWAVPMDVVQRDATRGDEALAWNARLRAVLLELRDAQAQIRQLSQIQAAYLRRSSRTVQMLMNFIGNGDFAYGRIPKSATPASRIVERG